MFGNIFDQQKPGQLYHVNMEGGRTVLAEPDEQFADAVFYYWLMEITVEDLQLIVIPDGAMDIVFSPQIPEFSIVYPPAIDQFSIPLRGPIFYAGISFEPEAALQYFNIDIKSISNFKPGIETTRRLALERLVSNVQNIVQIEQIKNIFDAELSSNKLKAPNKVKPSTYQCFVEELDAGNTSKVAEKLGISPRQFRRTVHDVSGLSPKQVQRIVRLQQLLHEIFSEASLDLQDGYYDDSHRIKELKSLIGMTYGELRRMAEIYNSSL